MNFLEKIKFDLNERQRSIEPKKVLTSREALRDLLHHFERLDADARANYRKNINNKKIELHGELTWLDCQKVTNLSIVHEHLQAFSDDPTGDSSTALVKAVLNATNRQTDYEYVRDEGLEFLIGCLNADPDGDEAEPYIYVKFLCELGEFLKANGIKWITNENYSGYQILKTPAQFYGIDFSNEKDKSYVITIDGLKPNQIFDKNTVTELSETAKPQILKHEAIEKVVLEHRKNYPTYIFATGDKDALKIGASERRFYSFDDEREKFENVAKNDFGFNDLSQNEDPFGDETQPLYRDETVNLMWDMWIASICARSSQL